MKRIPTTVPPLTPGMTEGARVAAASAQNEAYAQQVVAHLTRNGPSTLAQILAGTGMAVTHANRALDRLVHTGRAYNDGSRQRAVWHLLAHGLPTRSAALTDDARIIRDWLTGRTDTITHMVGTLSMSRERIVEGLARLLALGLLHVTGVGALPLFTLRSVAMGRRAS